MATGKSTKRRGAPSHEGAVMTCAEIAAVMGCTPRTVENLLARALRKLRVELRKGDVEALEGALR